MMTSATTLTTKRLTLRGLIESDLAPYSDFIVNSPHMVGLVGNDTVAEVSA